MGLWHRQFLAGAAFLFIQCQCLPSSRREASRPRSSEQSIEVQMMHSPAQPIHRHSTLLHGQSDVFLIPHHSSTITSKHSTPSLPQSLTMNLSILTAALSYFLLQGVHAAVRIPQLTLLAHLILTHPDLRQTLWKRLLQRLSLGTFPPLLRCTQRTHACFQFNAIAN